MITGLLLWQFTPIDKVHSIISKVIFDRMCDLISMDKMRTFPILIFLSVFTLALSQQNQNTSGTGDASDICKQCACTSDTAFTLDCSNRKIEKIPAAWPEHNADLVAIFSFNNITTLDPLPATERKLKIVLDHCGIRYLQPNIFNLVKNVEFIDLSYNLLTSEEIDGEDFKGPYNNSKYEPLAVKHLDLSYNRIHSLPAKFFETMTDLEELNLEGNDFKVLDHSTQLALGSLGNLRRFNLANNELTELVGQSIEKMTNLIELNLAANLLDFVPVTLDLLQNTLQVLDLSYNLIFELKADSFVGLKSITELYLNDLQRLEVISPDTFATMPELWKLSLKNNTKLRTIDRDAFGKQQRLQELHITNTALRELDYNLLKWSALKVFQLGGNDRLECDCNIYNITKDLNALITRNLNGPVCVESGEGVRRMVFELDETICETTFNRKLHIITQNFNAIRVIMITLSIIITVGTIGALGVILLKRSSVLSSRTFAEQVRYNPLRQQTF